MHENNDSWLQMIQKIYHHKAYKIDGHYVYIMKCISTSFQNCPNIGYKNIKTINMQNDFWMVLGTLNNEKNGNKNEYKRKS